MAQFHVIDTFTLESRNLLILAGSIAEGTIRRGQFVRLPVEGTYRCVPITAIEFLLRRNLDREDVCLCIDFTALDALGLRHDLALADVIVEVTGDVCAT